MGRRPRRGGGAGGSSGTTDARRQRAYVQQSLDEDDVDDEDVKNVKEDGDVDRDHAPDGSPCLGVEPAVKACPAVRVGGQRQEGAQGREAPDDPVVE